MKKEPVSNPAQLVAWAHHWSVQAPPTRRDWLRRALTDWAITDGADILLAPPTAQPAPGPKDGWGFIEGVSSEIQPELLALRTDLEGRLAISGAPARMFTEQATPSEKIRLVISHLWSIKPSEAWEPGQSFTNALIDAKAWDKALLLGNKEGRASLEDTQDMIVFGDESRWVLLLSQDARIAESAAQDHDYDLVPYTDRRLHLMSFRDADGFSKVLVALNPQERIVHGIWGPGYASISKESVTDVDMLLTHLGARGVLSADAMPREWVQAHVTTADLPMRAIPGISPATAGMVMH